MEIYDLQDIQHKKDYKSGATTLNMLNIMNSYGLTDYRIAKLMGIHQSYISKRKRYKQPAGVVPRWRYYLSLQVLFKIVLSDRKSHGQVKKERVLTLYQGSIAKELHDLWGRKHTSGRSSHSSNKLSSLS